MIVFRIVQGIGSAMMSAIAGALVVRAFPLAERGRILGITLSAAYAGLTAGPAVGGVLVELFGWRSIFYVNVPIGIATVLLAFIYLSSERVPRTDARFDFPGASRSRLSSSPCCWRSAGWRPIFGSRPCWSSPV